MAIFHQHIILEGETHETATALFNIHGPLSNHFEECDLNMLRDAYAMPTFEALQQRLRWHREKSASLREKVANMEPINHNFREGTVFPK